MTAFVDESMRLRVHGLYVVAAVVVIEEVDAARHAARSVLVRRQPHADAADRRTIVAAQRARRASPTLDYRFDRALDEPILWMADALAGAAAAHVAEGADYLDLLGGLVTRTDIGP